MYQMGIFAGEVGHIFTLANTTRSGEFQKSGFRQIKIEQR